MESVQSLTKDRLFIYHSSGESGVDILQDLFGGCRFDWNRHINKNDA